MVVREIFYWRFAKANEKIETNVRTKKTKKRGTPRDSEASKVDCAAVMRRSDVDPPPT